MNFSRRYAYEKPAVDRDGKNEKLQLLHRYTTDRYQLIAVEGGGGADSLAPEYALVELIPDPFKVSYHVSSIVVDGRRISIANKTGSEVLVREI